MSWREHDDDPYGRLGRPGGDWQGIRSTLDNPLSWAMPIGRCAGIAVRIHFFFVIYIVVQLAIALRSPDVGTAVPLGFSLVAASMACLFVIVLLHEFGHCIACRRVGGAANEILMWPLGGLAFCRPPTAWRAHLVTALGGPLVNVAIMIVLAPALGLLTGNWLGAALPNPLVLDPYAAELADGRQPWWLLIMFLANDISFVLLLFNLLPIFPLDGGRICQAALWPRFGYVRSMRLAVYGGYFGAIALFIFGAVNHGNWMLMGVALFGGVTCYITLKQLEWTEGVMGDGEDLYAASRWGYEDEPDDAPDAPDAPDEVHAGGEVTGVDVQTRRKTQALEEEAALVDRILAKIAEYGMNSLSPRERRVLKRATDRRRREGE